MQVLVSVVEFVALSTGDWKMVDLQTKSSSCHNILWLARGGAAAAVSAAVPVMMSWFDIKIDAGGLSSVIMGQMCQDVNIKDVGGGSRRGS